MFFDRLSMSGVKDSTIEASLGQVTLIHGDNASGKSAIMEALRLAITGSADIGAQGAKQSLLASSNAAEAFIEGSGLHGRWGLKVGKTTSKTHSLHQGDQPVDVEAVIGRMPMTVSDWWGLSGEDRWRLVGSVTTCEAVDSMLSGKITKLSDGQIVIPDHKITLTNAEMLATWAGDNVKESQRVIKQLQVTANPPDLYMGRASAEIAMELEQLQAEIAQQKKARDGIAHREAMAKKDASDLETLRAELQKLEEAHAKSKAHSIEYAEALTKAEELDNAYRSLEPFTPEIVIQARQQGWTTRRCLEEINSQLNVLIDTACDLATQADNLEAAKAYLPLDAAMRSMFLGTHPSTLDQAMPIPEPLLRLREVLSKYKVRNILDLKGLRDATSLDLTSQSSRLLSIQRSIEQIESRQQIECVAFGPLLPEDQYAQLLQRRDEVVVEQRKAQEWETWKQRSKDTADKLAKERARLDELESIAAKIRSLRTDMLKSSVGVVEAKANEFLEAMGLSPLALSVTSTAKTSALTLTNSRGVDIAAMAGSERIQYGAALISALQELSSAPCPVLFVEAAELNPKRLSSLLHAMTKRTKGNVFVAHWSMPITVPGETVLVECGELAHA